MPKLKTNKAAKKRFKVTAKGKVLRLRTKRRHLLTDKSGSEKRSLRRWSRVDETDEKRFRALLPYS
jgi:large subunit ribosomal protein L35